MLCSALFSSAQLQSLCTVQLSSAQLYLFCSALFSSVQLRSASTALLCTVQLRSALVALHCSVEFSSNCSALFSSVQLSSALIVLFGTVQLRSAEVSSNCSALHCFAFLVPGGQRRFGVSRMGSGSHTMAQYMCSLHADIAGSCHTSVQCHPLRVRGYWCCAAKLLLCSNLLPSTLFFLFSQGHLPM